MYTLSSSSLFSSSSSTVVSSPVALRASTFCTIFSHDIDTSGNINICTLLLGSWNQGSQFLCRHAQGTSAYSGEERRTACQHIVGQVQRSVSKLDDDVGLVFKFHDVGLAKAALLVVQAARYTCSIAMSVGNCSCKIDEVWF